MTEVRNILWVDDEIEMLTPHLLFLREKGFTVTPVANGEDAVSLVRDRSFDLVLLDEMMPGKDGLQTLQEIRHFNPNIPIVMVTKNEEEQIMDQAIGRRADDYLLKPAIVSARSGRSRTWCRSMSVPSCAIRSNTWKSASRIWVDRCASRRTWKSCRWCAPTANCSSGRSKT